MRFKVDKSVDCVSHDGIRYIPHSVTREIEVPHAVGCILLQVGAGCSLIPDDQPPSPTPAPAPETMTLEEAISHGFDIEESEDG